MKVSDLVEQEDADIDKVLEALNTEISQLDLWIAADTYPKFTKLLKARIRYLKEVIRMIKLEEKK